jgi:hypothetical protein
MSAAIAATGSAPPADPARGAGRVEREARGGRRASGQLAEGARTTRPTIAVARSRRGGCVTGRAAPRGRPSHAFSARTMRFGITSRRTSLAIPPRDRRPRASAYSSGGRTATEHDGVDLGEGFAVGRRLGIHRLDEVPFDDAPGGAGDHTDARHRIGLERGGDRVVEQPVELRKRRVDQRARRAARARSEPAAARSSSTRSCAPT